MNTDTGEIFTNTVTLVKGTFIKLHLTSVDGTIQSIEMLNTIPKGLSFNSTDSTITGLVRSDLTPLYFYVRGYTSDDYIDFNFPIVLHSNCSETMKEHRYVFTHEVNKVYDPSYQKITFILKHGNDEIRNEELNPNIEVELISQCYPNTVYTHSVEVSIDVPVKMDLYVDGILSYSYIFETFTNAITFNTSIYINILLY